MKWTNERGRYAQERWVSAVLSASCVCVYVRIVLFEMQKKRYMHCILKDKHKCSSQKSKWIRQKKTHGREEIERRIKKKICASRKDLKKEQKLLAMIEPTHRMFTITCALRRESETHIHSVVLCSFVSILVSTARLFYCCCCCCYCCWCSEAISLLQYSFLATIL